MNAELLNRILALTWMIGAILCGAATIGLVILMAFQPSMILLGVTALMVILTIAFGVAMVGFGNQLEGRTVFTNAAEREVLSVRQRRELRKARGEVVMERALIDVEHERQNIVHRQIEAANDPDKPPHQTAWTPKAAEGMRKIGRDEWE